MAKSPEAFRTISEVAELLETPAHVLRFWESRFTQIKPVKRAGGRRYYRPADVALLGGIRKLLHDDGMTIRGVQKVLREQGVHHVGGLVTVPLSPISDDAVYEIEAVAIEPALTEAATEVRQIETTAPQPETEQPLAVTGFALESFVAKHGGKGLPLQGQDISPSRSAETAEPEFSIPDLPQIASGDAEGFVNAPAPVPDVELPSSVVDAAQEPDAEPRQENLAAVEIPSSAETRPPQTSAAITTPTRIPQRGQTPEDAVAMVDISSLSHMGASLRRVRPAALEGAEPQLAAIYDRMRALRLRLAQDVGTARR